MTICTKDDLGNVEVGGGKATDIRLLMLIGSSVGIVAEVIPANIKASIGSFVMGVDRIGCSASSAGDGPTSVGASTVGGY